MLSSAGIGSGLDIDSLVTQLVNAEAAPTTQRLDRQQAEFDANLSGLGQFSSALASFQSALGGLTNINNYQNRTVDLNNPDFVEVTATSSAPLGDIDIAVENLATVQKLQSVDFASSADSVGSGELTIIAGTQIISVSISSPDDSLTDLRDAINEAAAGKGMQAIIINVDDDSGGTVSRLQMTTIETGESESLSIFVNDSDGNNTDAIGLSRFAYDPAGIQNMTQTQAAENAVIRIDGQLATRSSNTIDDAIDGITFKLLDENPAEITHATITHDEDSAKAQVQAFTSAYNKLIDVVKGLTMVDPESRTVGLLQGDAAVKGFERLLRGNLFAGSGDTQSISNLTQLGIETDPQTGHLSVDQERLDAAGNLNIQDIGQFFAGENGLAVRLGNLVDDYVGDEGSITQREKSIQTGIGRLGDQRVRLSIRLEGLDARLRQQFIAMDILVGQLNQVSGFLTQQLANLPGSVFRPKDN